MATNYPINPRTRAYGKARIDIAERAKNPADWAKLWKNPTHPFPFVWGESWKQCVEYRVDDFAAEVGFFIDVLGLPVNAFDPGYAMFTSPKGDFYFAVTSTPPAGTSTPPDAIRLQFMVKDVMATTHELVQRGIFFEQPPQPLHPGSSVYIGYFRTPHGICIELWGTVKAGLSSDLKLSSANNHEDGDETDEADELEEDDHDENLDEDKDLDQEGGKNRGSLDDNKEFDEEDDDDDDDEEEDDDEFNQHEGSTEIKSNLRAEGPLFTPVRSRDANSNPPGKLAADQKCPDPEYFDLDAT